jgi:threonine synthase
LWRYREVLPLPGDVEPVSLGEGGTPLLRAQKFADDVDLWIKDESLNPTQSFKARGMSVAVSMAKYLGATKLAVPSAGNAGGALAAYAARAGLEAHIFMPRDTPRANIVECRELGAHVTLIDGLITDCGAEIGRRKAKEGWFDMSTLKEPYRVEGKKTLGYELAEQCEWRLPDVILYPTGGGTGLVGIWKAYEELAAMGWIKPAQPRFIAVQAEGCAPVVKAWNEKAENTALWENPVTNAPGLRVPGPFAGRQMLKILRDTDGSARAVSEREIVEAQRLLARTEGIWTAPEAAAALAALIQLKSAGQLDAGARALLVLTGCGIKNPPPALEPPIHLDGDPDKILAQVKRAVAR